MHLPRRSHAVQQQGESKAAAETEVGGHVARLHRQRIHRGPDRLPVHPVEHHAEQRAGPTLRPAELRRRPCVHAVSDHRLTSCRCASNSGSEAVADMREKCLLKYSSKSKSRSEMPLCRTPHIASRKSDMNFICRRSRSCASPAKPKYATRSSRSCSSSNPWLTEKFARSKNRSPMPAYSQSTIRIAPSSRKLAFSRSLWQGTGGCGPRAERIFSDIACAVSNSAGTWTPCAAA